MADQNIQMGQRNTGNTVWDNHYPKTKAENVITPSGTLVNDIANIALKANQTALDTTNINVSANATAIANIGNASPKGTYTTLVTLQAAFPTGMTGIYVVTADGNWYYWNGTAWTAGGTYQSTGIADGSITPNKLSFLPIQAVPGKNLFNKLTVTPNNYISYTDGSIIPSVGWSATEPIAQDASTPYVQTRNYQLAFYDASMAYISGITDGTYAYTTPANCAFVRISVPLVFIDDYQLEKGTVTTLYLPYLPQVPKNQTSNFHRVIIVAKTGGDYDTISAAVTASNSNVLNHVTILIMPGTYIESVDLRGKYISLVGIDKNTCIIRNDEGDYWRPPINIDANNNVSNLTVISTADAPTGGSPGFSPYAIHADSGSTEGTSELYNCHLIGEANVALGIGLHNNQTLIVNGCDIDSIYNGMTAHNWQLSGAVNQRLIVKNNHVKSGNEYALFLQDANHREGGTYDDLRDTVFSFYNNVFWSAINGKTNTVGGDAPLDANSKWGYIKLSPDSFGNNLTEINVQ